MIKAIIFDFDGVIVESVDIKTQAFCEIFKNMPRHVDAIRHYQQTHGGISRQRKFKHIYKNILKKSLSKEKLESLCKQFERLVLEKVIKSPFVVGAEELLKKAKGKYAMYVISGTPGNELNLIVQKRGLAHYFDGVYGTPRTKDTHLKNILKKQKLKPSEAVFVGDSLTDFSAAKVMKVPFIARITKEELDWYADPYIHGKYFNLKPVWNVIQSMK